MLQVASLGENQHIRSERGNVVLEACRSLTF
jgi:hypothetical protein